MYIDTFKRNKNMKRKIFIMLVAFIFPLALLANEPERNDDKISIMVENILRDFVTNPNAKVISYVLEDVFTTERMPIEDWMLEELIPKEEEPVIEDWMFEPLKK